MKKRLIICALAVVVSCGMAHALEEDNAFGGRSFARVTHSFDNGLYLRTFFEYDDYQSDRSDCWYNRTSLGVNILPWLKVGVNYVPVCNHGNNWKNYGEFDVVGTLKSGGFKVSIRERYRHGFTGTVTNELRSRLKVEYSIPDSEFGVYVAPEVITWGDTWKKTRHYVACTYNVNDWMQIEGYYLYYVFRSEPTEHIIGVGINFDIL